MNNTANESKPAAVETVTRHGVTAKIRTVKQIKGGTTYTAFIVDYTVLGKRKQVSRSSYDDAKTVAIDACKAIANGETAAASISETELNVFARAQDTLSGVGKALDLVAHEYADAVKLLGGRVTLIEACRFWSQQNDGVTLTAISTADAIAKLVAGLEAEKRNGAYVDQVRMALAKFAEKFPDTAAIRPALVASYLNGMALSERSKANARDYVGKLNRWLVLHNHLPKSTNWLDRVQKYSKQKRGEVNLYTPVEMQNILNAATCTDLPVLAIGAFSGMRHSEICRLRWENVELSDKPGESFIEVLGGKNERHGAARRLVPVSDNLKAWLKKCYAKTGPVCPLSFEQSKKHLPHVVKKAGVTHKRNALRDSGISYRIALTGDVSRVADDSGNSPAVIRSNYLRRVKPSLAAEWFNIFPTTN